MNKTVNIFTFSNYFAKGMLRQTKERKISAEKHFCVKIKTVLKS